MSAGFLPMPPRTGRSAPPIVAAETERGLWSQLLTAFRDMSGAFDSFANDADPQVRALGRSARGRRPAHADDFFAIGDLCAELAGRSGQLNQTYLAKAIAAYSRAADIDPSVSPATRGALVSLALWVAECARVLGGDEAIDTALLACERIAELLASQSLADAERVRRAADELQQASSGQPSAAPSGDARGARQICEQGQMLLRQGRPLDALPQFERALSLDDRHQPAWLWRAMALTDLRRFDEALTSYDRALAIEPDAAGVWNNKGSLLMELGSHEQALACFRRALNLSGATASVKAIYWLNTGKVLYMLARYAEARDALTRAHELDASPESAAGLAACAERLSARHDKERL